MLSDQIVTLQVQMARVARFSYGFFTAMAGNMVGKENQDSSMYFYSAANKF